MNTLNTSEAFSLVELMVVIAIIGILSAIAVPSYKTYVIRSRVAELITLSENIQFRIVDKFNTGTTWASITDLGFTAAPTSTYVSATAAAPSANATATTFCGSTTADVGSISITGNATALGLPSGALTLVKVGCVSNDIITWTCGVQAANAANVIYLPSNCQSITMTYP